MARSCPRAGSRSGCGTRIPETASAARPSDHGQGFSRVLEIPEGRVLPALIVSSVKGSGIHRRRVKREPPREGQPRSARPRSAAKGDPHPSAIGCRDDNRQRRFPVPPSPFPAPRTVPNAAPLPAASSSWMISTGLKTVCRRSLRRQRPVERSEFFRSITAWPVSLMPTNRRKPRRHAHHLRSQGKTGSTPARETAAAL